MLVFSDNKKIGSGNIISDGIVQTRSSLINGSRKYIESLPQSRDAIIAQQQSFLRFIENPELCERIEKTLESLSKLPRDINRNAKRVVARRKIKDHLDDYYSETVTVPDYSSIVRFKKGFEKSFALYREMIDSISFENQMSVVLRKLSQYDPEELKEEWDEDEKILIEMASIKDCSVLGVVHYNAYTGEVSTISPIGNTQVDLTPDLKGIFRYARKKGIEDVTITVGDREFLLKLSPFSDMSVTDWRQPRSFNNVRERVWASPSLSDMSQYFKTLDDKLKNFNFRQEEIEGIMYHLAVANFYRKNVNNGISMCFPEILPHEERKSLVEEFDPRYLYGDSAVPINLSRDVNQGSVHFITGLNSGGKTSYLRNHAFVQLWAQAGLPIPAKSGSISLVDKIIGYRTRHDNVEDHLSRFVNEVKSIKEICEMATKHSLVLLDEPFTSTDVNSSISAYGRLLDRLNETQVFITTHNTEAVTRYSSNNNVIALMMDDKYQTVPGIGHSEGERVLNQCGF